MAISTATLPPGFIFASLQRRIGHLEHEQLLGDGLVGVVGRDLEMKKIHLEIGEVGARGNAVDPYWRSSSA